MKHLFTISFLSLLIFSNHAEAAEKVCPHTITGPINEHGIDLVPLDEEKQEIMLAMIDEIKKGMGLTENFSVLGYSLKDALKLSGSHAALFRSGCPSCIKNHPVIGIQPTIFFLGSKESQKFVLAHELAHYKLGHGSSLTEKIPLGLDLYRICDKPSIFQKIKFDLCYNKWSRNREYAADELAVKSLGSIKGGVQELRQSPLLLGIICFLFPVIIDYKSLASNPLKPIWNGLLLTGGNFLLTQLAELFSSHPTDVNRIATLMYIKETEILKG